MSVCVQYPSAGCIVEYLEGNAIQIALVTEESGGKLRLLLPNRRETRLTTSRLLPWAGPALGSVPGKDESARVLEQHRARREELAAALPVLELWEMSQGEVPEASAQWFAELAGQAGDADSVAACGRALLACKSHFRFQPPVFQIFSAEMVEKRLKEQQERAAREALVLGGNSFFRLLWDVACKKRALPPQPGEDTRGISEWPAPEVAERLKQILFARMADPESQEYDELWRMLSKGLPDVPHLPVQLLMAWEQVPAHYNFWYDRAGYAPGDDWWQPLAPAVEALQRAAREVELPACDLPFISIDSATTRDVDDAFHILPTDDGGFDLTLALACPAACWPFGEALDKAVFRRGTSIYLPEGDSHMMPEALGTDAFSLLAGQDRPAFCVRTRISDAGEILSCEPWAARVRLAANLTYDDTQAVLDALAAGEAPQADNPAAPWATMLACGNDFARVWQKARIARGAVIMDRPEPSIVLEGEGAQTRVSIEPGHETPDSQPLVAEMMILASAAVAQWAAEREIPMLHRTQDVALPREYAGVWKEPQDMTRIMRALIPSSLEVQARPHAALGLARYTPMTSPLRRYPDLINEAQLLHWLTHGTPRWDSEALSTLLVSLNAVLDAAGQVQRFRPRYWKLLYFRQQGDKVWWDGVVTEENDMFVNVSLPAQGMYVRGKRRMFDERTCPGMAVQVRIGRVHPLYNEIQILEAVSMDG